MARSVGVALPNRIPSLGGPMAYDLLRELGRPLLGRAEALPDFRAGQSLNRLDNFRRRRESRLSPRSPG